MMKMFKWFKTAKPAIKPLPQGEKMTKWVAPRTKELSAKLLEEYRKGRKT